MFDSGFNSDFIFNLNLSNLNDNLSASLGEKRFAYYLCDNNINNNIFYLNTVGFKTNIAYEAV